MNKKILEAFAQEIHEDFQGQFAYSPTGIQASVKRAYAVSLVTNIAKRFNPRFDEARFRRACGLDSSVPN